MLQIDIKKLASSPFKAIDIKQPHIHNVIAYAATGKVYPDKAGITIDHLESL